MSDSARASRSNARSRSSRENRFTSAISRSRSPSPAISGSLTREGSTDSTSRSRTVLDSSRHTARRSYPISTARPASSNAAGAFSSATASTASSSRSRPTSPNTVATSPAPIVLPVNAITWSSLLCASRMLPSASRAMSSSESSPTSISIGVDDAAKLVANRLAADRPELVHLRARQDRFRNLVELGRRHHEHDVRRRLFDRLQQGVERRRRQLVHFVDDEHLEPIAHRHDAEAGDDHLAHVVDAGVRGGVDLEDVHVAPFGDLDARVTDAAGIGRRPVHAVQRARQNARRRRLADAPRSGKHERLRQPLARERVAQRTRHRLLPDDIVELLRPPFARDDLVGHLEGSRFRGLGSI